jgi:hypothetical protein
MDTPQKAEIIEQKDNGAEVSSKCPGAPKKPAQAIKAKDLDTIARNLGPDLAFCARMVNDPDQTAALAKFAEGKMSYAEMRSRCG